MNWGNTCRDTNSQKLQRGTHTYTHTHTCQMESYTLSTHDNTFLFTHCQHSWSITFVQWPAHNIFAEHLSSSFIPLPFTYYLTLTQLDTLGSWNTYRPPYPDFEHTRTPRTKETHINISSHNKHTYPLNTYTNTKHTLIPHPHTLIHLLTHIQSLSHKLNIKTNTRIYTHQPQILWSLVSWSRGRGGGKSLPCIKPRPFQLFPGFDPEVSQQCPRLQSG